MGLHPSEVIHGYELARARAADELESVYARSCSFVQVIDLFISPELSVYTIPQKLTLASMKTALKPAIASKQYGSEEVLASLVAEAALAVMPSVPTNFNVDNVRVVKIMGGSLRSSKVVNGMVFGREPEGEAKAFKLWKPCAQLCQRYNQEGNQSQSCCIHLRNRYLADRNEGNCSAEELRRATQLYNR